MHVCLCMWDSVCMSMSLYVCGLYAQACVHLWECENTSVWLVFVYECVNLYMCGYMSGYSVNLCAFVHNIFVTVQVRMGICLWLYIWYSTNVYNIFEFKSLHYMSVNVCICMYYEHMCTYMWTCKCVFVDVCIYMIAFMPCC